MKILQITPAYKPAFIYGGPTVSVSLLAEHLVQAGEDIEVYTTTANGKDELEVQTETPVNVDGVPTIYFKRITTDHTHFSPGLLRKLWRQCKDFDVVHIHGWWNTVSVLACLVTHGRGVPVIVSPRGMLSNYSFNNRNNSVKGMIHRFLGKRLLEKSFIHVTSVNEYNAVLALVKPKEIFDIPNFINFGSVRKSLRPLADGKLRLIYLSRIEEKKGLDILLEALAAVTVPYFLTISGTGDANYVDQLKKAAGDYGISSKIDWIGFQNENKFEILAAHDVMVLPSHDENFGNVVIESLSVGTAVLVSDQVGLADYVLQNRLGWVCKTEPASVAQAINELFNQQATLKQITDIAPPLVNAHFGGELTAKYIEMYKRASGLKENE